jgi:hypothetical protein
MTAIVWILNKNKRLQPIIKYKPSSNNALAKKREEQRQKERRRRQKEKERAEAMVNFLCRGFESVRQCVSKVVPKIK